MGFGENEMTVAIRIFCYITCNTSVVSYIDRGRRGIARLLMKLIYLVIAKDTDMKANLARLCSLFSLCWRSWPCSAQHSSLDGPLRPPPSR